MMPLDSKPRPYTREERLKVLQLELAALRIRMESIEKEIRAFGSSERRSSHRTRKKKRNR